MKNPVIFYAVIVLGALALGVGAYYQFATPGLHPVRAYTALGIGAVVFIAGIVGMFMTRSSASAAK
jgi:hypothetical protein